MKAEIVSVSSHNPHEDYYHFDAMKNSVKRVGSELTLLGDDRPWQGLMTKPNIIRQWLRDARNQTEIVLFLDAWDIILTKHPDQILEDYENIQWSEETNSPLLFNAERNCFPGGEHCNYFPETGTPWRYLNSGVIIGPAAKMLRLLESMDLEAQGYDRQKPDQSWVHPNDQEEYLKAFVKQPVPMVLDTKAELAISLHGTTLEEIEFGEQVRNLVTDTVPGIWHGNGRGKNDILPTLIKHLGL
jgi:hypothetical protein